MQTTDQEVTVKTAQQLGLSEGEFEEIKRVLGRGPNFMELSIYAAIWSEQCSFKNSIKWLNTLPMNGNRLLINALDDKAALVDIGSGLGCIFKINSHNHFLASEPFQGTASEVGGTHRDISATGARPIAALNSLRFGSPNSKHTQLLINEVVKGVGDSGNCLGVPTVGGKVYFHDSFQQNIVVNTMSIGIAKIGETIAARADGPGNPVFIIKAKTGKDVRQDIITAAGSSEGSEGNSPTPTVFNPLHNKLLLEASLEAIKTGAVVGMQNIGAAGIVCSSAEMCAKAETGMHIYLNKITTLQSDLDVREMLLSELEERMLMVAVKGKEQALLEVFEKWEVECVHIGEVTDTGNVEYFMGDEKLADVPANSLVLGGGAPVYDQALAKPKYFNEIKRFNLNRVKSPKNIIEAAKKLFSAPNLASKRWVFEQYDSMVRTNNLNTNAPADSAVLRIKDSDKLLAVSMDGNSSYVHADPYIGAMIAVSEAARNITCAGGVPVAVANCLNYGDPYDPEVYYQFVNAVKGLGEACRKFDTPVISANVSFYNQSNIKDRTEPIFPTPIIGMLGIIEDPAHHTSLHFKEEGDMIYMLGNLSNDLGSSEYLRTVLNIQYSPPPEFDLYEEFEIQKHIRKLIRQKIVRSAHDVSDGGLFTNLMESAIASDLGFNIETVDTFRIDSFLFGEGQSRIVITIAPEQEDALQNYLINNNVSFSKLGEVFGDVAIINEENFGSISHWKRIHEDTLSAKLDG